jgi:mannose-6-phosphate isomerase-like protein (cupin superfamily)
MERVNAIAKVRFASSAAQRARLHRSESLRAELLCLEPGQQVAVQGGEWVYYVIKGRASMEGGDGAGEMSSGELAAPAVNESHRIVNVGEQRLICFVVGHAP